MAPAYPKTDSEADRAATARYWAMNNLYFLNPAMYGEYPEAFVGETPYAAMGYRPGDDKIMKAPLIGWDSVTTPAASSRLGV